MVAGGTVQSTGKADMATTKVKIRGKTPVSIEPSGDGPGLFRIKYADGTLSDVVNLARAQDALRAAQDGQARAVRARRLIGSTVA